MKASFAALLAVAGFAVADYNTVNNDLNYVSSLVSKLDSDINSFFIGGLFGLPTALQIQVDSVNVDEAIQQATSDTQKSAKFGSTGSQTILTTVQALQPKVIQSLNDIITKNSTFDFLRPIVLDALLQLRDDTTSFGIAAFNKLSPSTVQTATASLQSIEAAFSKAIGVYS